MTEVKVWSFHAATYPIFTKMGEPNSEVRTSEADHTRDSGTREDILCYLVVSEQH